MFALLLAPAHSWAQDWNTARLAVLSGGTVDFFFNSLDKYENGITFNSGTVLGITIANLADGSTLASWDLDFSTSMSATDLTGSGGNTLPLNTVRVTPSNNLGLGAATFSADLPLSTATQTLVTTADPTLLNIDWTTHQVAISYAVGTLASNNLLEETADFYTVEIEFTLEPGF